jgi:hypothetical protein
MKAGIAVTIAFGVFVKWMPNSDTAKDKSPDRYRFSQGATTIEQFGNIHLRKIKL